MNESNNIVEAPTSQVSHSQSEDLRREIAAYAESHASLLEEINKKNENLQHLLQNSIRKTQQINELRKQNGSLGRTIHELRVSVAELKDDIINLEDTANNNYNAYKEQCRVSGRLGNRVGELKQELREKNAEIALLRASTNLLSNVLANRE